MAGTVLTNKGLALITKLMAAQATLSFSRVAVGTGRVPSGYDAQNMTGLNEYKMDATIESCGVSTEQSDVAYIVTQISSVGVSTGFAITEAGVFATDPDDGEILYAYLDLTQDPQYIYASTDAISKFAEITFNVLVGSVTSVTAIVSPGALVKKSEFDNLKTRVEDVETPEFDASGTAESITDKTSLLASFVTKMPLVKFMRNVVAGFKLVLYSGQIVNNCVTDRPDLPGSAAQLKVLMDLYTVLNTNKSDKGILGSVVVNDGRTINLGNTGDTVQTFTIPTPGTYIIFGSICSSGTGSKSGLLGFEFNGSAGMDVYNQGNSYEDSTNGFRGLQHSSPVVVHTANASIRYRIYNSSTGSYTLRFIALRLK